MKRELKRYDRKHGIHHPLLALDFENNPDTGDFICCGVYGDIRHRTTKRINGTPTTQWTTKRIEEYFDNQADLLEWLLELPKNSCILVFYNLSYDRWFMDTIIDHSTVLAVGSRVILLKLKNGLKGIDLFNQTMMGSLEDWIGYLDMAKKGIKKAELTDYYNRVMNDVKATYELGVFLEDFYYYECGIPLQVTVGASAMRLFTMKYFTDYWQRDNDWLSLYERKAYYGGRCELFKRGINNTWSYDVNSMYLSIMRYCKLPDMATTKYISKKPRNWRKYLEKFLGIWNVKVYCPDNLYLPILPLRWQGKLKFPTGVFTGYWTNIELLEAEKNGYKILKVYDFIYYRKSKHYFSEYAKFVWEKRVEFKHKNNLGMDLMIKRLGNALYGKFAQRNSNDYFGRLSDYDGKLPDIVQFHEYKGETWVLIKGELTPAKFEFPAISAFITSYARLKLHEAMKANEKNLIYVDTDSIKLNSPAIGITIGNELGYWQLELADIPVEYHRPKFYGDKRKGIPRRAELVSWDNEKEVWQYRKPLRYREAIKKGLIPNVWVNVIKQLTFEDDKRIWSKNDSKPLKYILENT